VLAFEVVTAVAEELRARHVESEIDILPRAVARLLDRLENQAERRLVRLEARGEAALIAHRRRQAALGEQLLQGVEHLCPVAQRLAEARRADRQDHELLHVEAVVGVRAAVDDVHLRHRHDRLVASGAELRQIAVQGKVRLAGRRPGCRE
jgi:hypothetical protein